MENNKHISYSASDFERYHSGKMSVQEMHALEKAALDDPFLADALDGYEHTDTSSTDLEEINKRLQGRKKNRVIAGGFNRQWMKIAAMLILIAGAVYLAVVFNNDKPDTPLAVNKEESFNAKEQIPASVTDSGTTAGTTDIARNETRIPPADVRNGNVMSTPAQPPVTDEGFYKNNEVSADKMVSNQTINKAEYFLEGKVKDIDGNVVPFANITTKSAEVVSDANGKFVLPANDSVSLATISAAHYNTRQSFLNSNMDQVIVLEPGAKSQLEEVVVTGMDARRDRSKEAAAATTRISKEQLSKKAAPPIRVPAGDTTIVLISNKPVYVKGVQYTGEVMLSFIVNRKGKARDIRVIRSLCKACDEEAKRQLLEQNLQESYGERRVMKIRF